MWPTTITSPASASRRSAIHAGGSSGSRPRTAANCASGLHACRYASAVWRARSLPLCQMICGFASRAAAAAASSCTCCCPFDESGRIGFSWGPTASPWCAMYSRRRGSPLTSSPAAAVVAASAERGVRRQGHDLEGLGLHDLQERRKVWRLQRARGRLRGPELVDLGTGSRSQLFEFACSGQHARFERPYRLVVRVNRAFEAAAYLIEVAGHREHPVVQVASKGADLLRVLGDALLPPAIGDGLEQGDQRRRARWDDAFRGTEFDERRIALQGRAEEGLAWKEHHHKLRRRFELVPIRLARELRHVVAHLTRVVGQPRRA